MQKSKLKMESTLLLGQGKHKSTNLLNAKRRNWEGKELHLITQQKGRLQLPASEGQMSLSKIPTTIKILSLKKIRFYSESNLFKRNQKFELS
jgi:hypothetical protein